MSRDHPDDDVAKAHWNRMARSREFGAPPDDYARHEHDWQWLLRVKATKAEAWHPFRDAWKGSGR